MGIAPGGGKSLSYARDRGLAMTNTELSRESSRFLKALWSKLDHFAPWEFKETIDKVTTYKDDKGEEHQIASIIWGGSIDVDRAPSAVGDEDPFDDIIDIFALSFNHWVSKIIADVTEAEKCSAGILYYRLHRGDRFKNYQHSFIHTEVIDLPLQTPQIIGGADLRGIIKPYTLDTPEMTHPAPIVSPSIRYTAFMDVAFVPTWD